MMEPEMMRSMADRLGAASEEVRYMAVKDLSRSNQVEAVPLLLDAVGDKSFRVREEALKGICAFPPGEIFPRLEKFLRNHENANLRTAAIEAFPRYGGEATPFLINLLQDQDEEVRNFTAVILGEILDPASVDHLISALADPDENVRHAAAETLGKIKDPRAVGPLIKCLEEDFWLQYPAVIALGNIGDPRATVPLLQLLDDEMLKQPVIEALGKIGDVSVIPVLSGILAHRDPVLRNDVIGALVSIQTRIERHTDTAGKCLPSIKKALDSKDLIDHLIAALASAELEVRKNAIIALGWLKQNRAGRELIRLLTDYETEEYVVGALVNIGEAALPDLIAELHNPDPKIQTSLIRCIGWIDQLEGMRACLPFLQSEDEEIRSQAVQAMGGHLEDEEIETAVLAMLPDPSPDIMDSLVQVLGRSRSPRLFAKILAELKGANHERRIVAVRTLGQMRNSLAFNALRDLLKDGSDEVRAEAYKALTLIHPEKLSTEIIIAGLSDKSPTVRKAVAACLSAIPRHELENNLILLLKDHDPEVRLASLEALGKIGSSSCIEHLMHSFASSNKRLRLGIVRVMGNIRDKTSTQFLTDLAKEGDPDVRRVAIESLGWIGDPRAIPNLIVTLDDPDWSIRGAAVAALGQIGDRRSLPHLIEKLDDPEDVIKKEAIVALGQMGAREAVNSILPLIHNENLQLDVLATLERVGVSDLDFFSEFLKRSNTRIRCLLVELLGRLGAPGSLELLCRILVDEFFTVRCRCARALAELGDRKAIPFLLRSQKEDPSDEVRKEAATALKKLDAGK